MRELASLFRSDLSLIISEFEFELLKSHFEISESLLHYLPFLLDEDELEESNSLPGFEQRKDFMCMGNWKHGPNKDAFLFLKEEIWPEIRRQRPDARLHVYGAYGSRAEQVLNDPDNGFLIRGWAASKREACTRHRVCLAPLRYGAGLKGKLIDSMRYGMPNVTTDIGAEGLAGNMDWNGYVANDPHEFSIRAVRLYEDQKAWNDFQHKGFDLLKSRFRREIFEGGFKLKLDELREHLQAQRSRNLTGALLWHHGALSTKYLSRWIEAKSKNKLQAPRSPGQTG
jgi:glycosyltransferase involved in cell wall biosynthesis